MAFIVFSPWDDTSSGPRGSGFDAQGRVLLSSDPGAGYWLGLSWYFSYAIIIIAVANRIGLRCLFLRSFSSLFLCAKWLLLFLSGYIIMTLWRTSRLCQQFQMACYDLYSTDIYLKRGNISQAEAASRDCLKHLGCPLPSSQTARLGMIVWELVRHTLHILFIGRFIESVMIRARNDLPLASMQARAFSVFLKYV